MLSAVTVDGRYLQQQQQEEDGDQDAPHFIFFHTAWSQLSRRVAPAWEQLADKWNTPGAQERKFCKVLV